MQGVHQYRTVCRNDHLLGRRNLTKHAFDLAYGARVKMCLGLLNSQDHWRSLASILGRFTKESKGGQRLNTVTLIAEGRLMAVIDANFH